jgi:hypothetical protein
MTPALPTPSLDTQLLTEERVAWIWNVSPRTIRAWREEGKVACVKKGKNLVRYQPSDVMADILGHYRRSAHAQLAGGGPEDALWQRIERLIQTAVTAQTQRPQRNAEEVAA